MQLEVKGAARGSRRVGNDQERQAPTPAKEAATTRASTAAEEVIAMLEGEGAQPGADPASAEVR